MTDTIETPIAAPNPWIDQAWAGVRTVAIAGMSFAIGRGWLANDTAVLLGIAGGIVWPIVAGQLKTRRRAAQLVTIRDDDRVPNAVIR